LRLQQSFPTLILTPSPHREPAPYQRQSPWTTPPAQPPDVSHLEVLHPSPKGFVLCTSWPKRQQNLGSPGSELPATTPSGHPRTVRCKGRHAQRLHARVRCKLSSPTPLLLHLHQECPLCLTWNCQAISSPCSTHLPAYLPRMPFVPRHPLHPLLLAPANDRRRQQSQSAQSRVASRLRPLESPPNSFLPLQQLLPTLSSAINPRPAAPQRSPQGRAPAQTYRARTFPTYSPCPS
jgi:hypothetical protein